MYSKPFYYTLFRFTGVYSYLRPHLPAPAETASRPGCCPKHSHGAFNLRVAAPTTSEPHRASSIASARASSPSPPISCPCAS
jgi:hypothetical protein